MLRSITSYAALLLAVSLQAQQGVYIRPHIDKKYAHNTDRGFSFITEQGHQVSGIPLRFWSPGGLTIGLNVGFRFPNAFIEIGQSQDEASVGTRLSYSQYVPEFNSYQTTGFLHYFGSAYGRTSIRYGMRLDNNNETRNGRNVRWEKWTTIGVDRWSRPPIPAKTGSGTGWLMNQMDTMTYSAEMITPVRANYYASFGFMMKAFNKKGHSVLNLGIFYGLSLSSIRPMVQSKMEFTDSSNGVKYVHVLRSTGSGLYLRISKDIYWNNIVKRKKDPGSLDIYD